MTQTQTKLSYIASSYRVRIEFTRAAAMEHELPPEEFIHRARAKMDSVRTKGEILDYMVFEKRFNECWKRMRQAVDAPENARVSLTLAAGAPNIGWINVEKATLEKALAVISVNAPREKVAQVKYEVFEAFVNMKLAQLGIFDAPHTAQLQGIYARATMGLSVKDVAIGTHPSGQETSDKPYSIVANKARQELMVVIRDIQSLRDKNTRETMFNLINQAIKQMNKAMPKVDFKIRKNDFVSGLQLALVGPEFLGVDLPLILLAAIGVEKKVASARQSAVVANYPGAGRMEVSVSQDKMEAAIDNFDVELYDQGEFEVTVEWVEKEMKRLGLVTPIPDEHRKTLNEAVAQKVDLSGMLIAIGDPGIGGVGPYIYPSYKDAEHRVDANIEEDDLDIRDIQQRATVSAGQLVAEIKFEKEPKSGKTVYGDEIPPPADAELIVRVGDGIKLKGKSKYYATADGLPTIDKESITLSKVLVHQGDVNLRTGNIRFDGPVEIKGSIDAGATVETTGDLIVHGTIRGAFVKSSGSIAVKQGIVTGTRGRVYASGDVQSEFIESSTITCGGDLMVVKALINSQIVCGGRIYVTAKDGVIAGGHLSCKDAIRTENLGFRNGAKTVLDVGVDWRAQNAVRIKEKRLAWVKDTQNNDRANLRELVQKSKAQMTARHKDMKEKLQKRLAKARVLVERVEESLLRVKAGLTFNEDAKIFVTEQLSANVEITIANQKITVPHDTAGVAVTSKRRKGTYIHPIEEIEAMEADGAA